MTKADTHIAQHGRVCQIALHARHRQLFREMAEHRVGNPEIAFSILEIDRVHLVGHGRGADFTLFQLLLEVTQRDVHPDIATGIEQYGVGTSRGVEQFGHGVVRFDLNGVGVERQPK
ncbi:hypothetical protein SDC9_176482 [bioreactor metagenome]|uniref:Uncharacterized protein n=1 Tax=bioreactor metagenome TaxID=1076179 RepID=A0A645GYC3_9ZZZZ